MFSKKGNALIEYALPLTLVLLISIPAWQAVSQGYSQKVETVFADNDSTNSLLGSSGSNSGNASGTTADSSQSNNTASSAGNPWVNTKNPVSPAIIESAGVNGYTEALAAYIYDLSQELQASGEINAKQASAIIDMANQGYRMAAIQKLLEDQTNLYPNDKQAFENALVTFNGETKTVKTWAYMFNKGINEPEYPEPVEAKKFKELFDKVVNSKQSISNPEIKQYVKNLGNEIIQVSNLFQNALTDIDVSVLPKDMVKTVYSQQTEKGSKNICTTGGGKANENDCED